MKLSQFQHYLAEQQIDICVFFHPDITITYFAQCKPSYALLCVSPVAADLYLTKLDLFPTLKDIAVHRLEKSWETTLRNAKARKVGINKESLTVAECEKLHKLYPEATFVDVGEKIRELRSQKMEPEIGAIKKSSQISDQAFRALLEQFSGHTFNTEISIATFLQQQFQQRGADCAFATIVASGKNAATPHHQTSMQKLKSGFLVLDFGAIYNNYCTDMSRTLYLGRPSKAQKMLYDCVLNAQEQAIEAAEEGKPFNSLDSVARRCLGKHAPYFIHSLGHGIGLEVHESPRFAADAHQTIAANQAFTIEPGVYFAQKLGIRIEDTLVFKHRAIPLTRSSKELHILSL